MLREAPHEEVLVPDFPEERVVDVGSDVNHAHARPLAIGRGAHDGAEYVAGDEGAGRIAGRDPPFDFGAVRLGGRGESCVDRLPEPGGDLARAGGVGAHTPTSVNTASVLNTAKTCCSASTLSRGRIAVMRNS